MNILRKQEREQGPVFTSRLTLRFYNDEKEKEFQKLLFHNFQHIRLYNIIVSLLLEILTLFIMVWKILPSQQNHRGLQILVYISSFLCFLNIMIYCFVSQKIEFMFKRRLVINSLITNVNYILIKIIFDMYLFHFQFILENLECLIFVFTSIICFLTLYVHFLFNSFYQNLLCNLIIIIIDCLFFKFYFSFETYFIYFVTLLILVTNSLIAYSNDIYSRVYFLNITNKSLKLREYFNTVFDGMKKNFFTVNMKGGLSFYNRGFRDVLNLTDKNETKFNVPSNLNVFDIFKKNKFTELIVESGEDIELDTLDKLNYFVPLLESITLINEELLNSNEDLYKFLNKFSNENQDMDKTTKECIYNFLSFFNQDKAYLSQSTKLKFTKTTNMNNDINNGNKSDLPIIATNTFKNSFNVSYIESEYPLNQIGISQNNPVLIGKINLRTFLTKLGKSKASNDDKEYLLYSAPLKSEELLFYIEESYKLKEKVVESHELSKLCKTLFFSKISHEFKNPICNMLETLEAMEDQNKPDLNRNKFESSAMTSKSPRPNNTFQINNLKCLLNILLFLVKDFTSYSQFSDLKEEIPSLDIQSTANKVSNKTVIPNSFKNSCTSFSNISGGIKGNFLNNECNYHQVVNKIMLIFLTKIQIDNKDSKFSLNLEMEGELPEILEIDKDLFESFIFNTFYHLYKNIYVGKVTLKIKLTQTEDKALLSFSFFVVGSYKLTSLYEFLLMETGRRNITNQLGKTFSNNILNENYRKLNTSFETYHLENLMNKNNPVLRNNVVDSFNNNFHSHLSCLFAEKLGAIIKLKIKTKKEFKITFSFKLDTSKLVLKSSEFFSSNEYIRDSRKLAVEIDHNSLINSIKKSENTKSNINSINKKKDSTIIKKGIQVFNTNKIAIEEIHTSNKLLGDFNIRGKEQETIEYLDESLITVKNEDNMNFEYKRYLEENSIVRIFNKSERSEKLDEECSNKPQDSWDINKEFLSIKEVKEKEKNTNVLTSDSYIIKVSGSNKYSSRKYSDNFRKDSFNSKSNEFIRDPTFRTNKTTVSPQGKIEEKNNDKEASKENMIYISTKLGNFIKQGTQMSGQSNFARVLICDDETLIQKTLKRFFDKLSSDLTNYFFEVHSVENGFECLNFIYKFYNSLKYIDILIIDETMPYMKGSHLIMLLKRMMEETNFRNITIISYTSYNSLDKIEYIYLQGADFVISKPISYEQFKKFFQSNLIKS